MKQGKAEKTEIKICGITHPEETDYLNEAGVSYAGFVLYEKSKRYIDIGKAEELMKRLSPGIKKVAVTVSPNAEMIGRLNHSPFDIVQIHGDLSLISYDLLEKPLWRAINIKEEINDPVHLIESELQMIYAKTEGILIDAADYGSGKSFDWDKAERISRYMSQEPGLKFILAGGLNAGNVAEGIGLFKPHAVDVSSGVEGENGKDRNKIFDFVRTVKEKDDNTTN